MKQLGQNLRFQMELFGKQDVVIKLWSYSSLPGKAVEVQAGDTYLGLMRVSDAVETLEGRSTAWLERLVMKAMVEYLNRALAGNIIPVSGVLVEA